MDLDTCIQPDDGVATFSEQGVFDQGTVAGQLDGLPRLVSAAHIGLPSAQRKRQAWLASGYPSTFPTVQDLTSIITTEQKFIQAGNAQDLDAIPGLYRQFKVAFNQYNADRDSPGLCPA